MTPDQLEPMLPRLADFILTHKHEVIDQWAGAVRRHPEIHSAEPFTFRQMVGHLPVLLDQLADVLNPQLRGIELKRFTRPDVWLDAHAAMILEGSAFRPIAPVCVGGLGPLIFGRISESENSGELLEYHRPVVS